MCKKSNDTDWIAYVLFAIIALPLFGLFLMGQPHPDDKRVGKNLLIVGVAIWVILGLVPIFN